MDDSTEPRQPGSPNLLALETSAYLRQHMHNPVDWRPWGDAALREARESDKPLLVSIGYSACHWCHVMEHESFADPETAKQMNEMYLPIKVDREERPDVDQIFMDTVVRLTGHGGWPLTVFCMPDGRPFYGGTYFPNVARQNMPSFQQVLQTVHEAYRERRDEVENSAEQILDMLNERPTGVAVGVSGPATVEAAARQIMSAADTVHGGFGGAPKFPTPTNLELLLTASDLLPKREAEAALEHCVLSCHEMARRGLYDQLAGGFHRYCVDAQWSIPHFEKMLYDQGLLLSVYVETWRRSRALGEDFEARRSDPDEELLWPVRETAAYLLEHMRGSEGGFYASEDADSEGVEGRFYVWRPLELAVAIGAEADDFADSYSVTGEGNFENGTSHLIDRGRHPRSHFASQRAELKRVRSERVHPAIDPKRVASWNGYAISGLARAGSLLSDPGMLSLAAETADFVIEHMRSADGTLLRVYAEGRSHVPAFLDDHAAMLSACLDLYRAGAGIRFLQAGLGFARQTEDRFFDSAEADLFLTPSDGEPLISRPRSDHDGATPHATGLACLGLLRVAELAGVESLRDVAEQTLASHSFMLERAPHAYPTLCRAIALRSRGLAVAVVIGESESVATRALAERARLVLHPDDAIVVAAPGTESIEGIDASWLRGRSEVATPTLYLCRGSSCSLPITKPDEIVREV